MSGPIHLNRSPPKPLVTVTFEPAAFDRLVELLAWLADSKALASGEWLTDDAAEAEDLRNLRIDANDLRNKLEERK